MGIVCVVCKKITVIKSKSNNGQLWRLVGDVVRRRIFGDEKPLVVGCHQLAGQVTGDAFILSRTRDPLTIHHRYKWIITPPSLSTVRGKL